VRRADKKGAKKYRIDQAANAKNDSDGKPRNNGMGVNLIHQWGKMNNDTSKITLSKRRYQS
jgi:hypothetical protein